MVLQNGVMADCAKNINPLDDELLQRDCDSNTNYDDQRSSVHNFWRDMTETDIEEALKELENE